MYRLNFNSAVPLYEQLERQTQFLIANGALPEGETIPSVRDAAKSLAVNPQTIVRAYSNLKSAGLIQPVRGQGFVVSEGARARCRESRLLLFQTRFEETLEEAVAASVSLEEIEAIFQRAVQKVAAKYFPNNAADHSIEV